MRKPTPDVESQAAETLNEARLLMQTLRSLDENSEAAAEIRRTVQSTLKSIRNQRAKLEAVLRSDGASEAALRCDQQINMCLLIEDELTTDERTKQ